MIRDVATIGLSVTNSDKTIDHVTIEARRKARHRRVPRTTTGSSPTRLSTTTTPSIFKDAPVSGGMEFCASARAITIKNDEVNNNSGSGIWFDAACYDMTMANNAANGNTKHGIEVEVSDTASSRTTWRPTAARTALSCSTPATSRCSTTRSAGAGLFGIKLTKTNGGRRSSGCSRRPGTRAS